MNQVIKRIALIVADPCDGYTCLCATCQQNVRDLEQAALDSIHYTDEQLVLMDSIDRMENGVTEFNCFGALCPCAVCRDQREVMERDNLRESWVAAQPTQELPTLQLPDAPARIHTHRW